jgi:hypothetical protein
MLHSTAFWAAVSFFFGLSIGVFSVGLLSRVEDEYQSVMFALFWENNSLKKQILVLETLVANLRKLTSLYTGVDVHAQGGT